MKNKILIILMTSCVICGCENKKLEIPSAEEILLQLQDKNQNLSEIEAFTEETDPNEKLGRPGYYISKADFSDSRLEQNDPDYLVGGTIEVFASKEDCKDRAEYLQSLADSKLGVFALDQYIYQYEEVLFRVEYGLTNEQAEEYHKQMDEIMEQYQ